jgi:hypothetical protein
MIPTATGRTQTLVTCNVAISQSCIISLSFEVEWSLRTGRSNIQNFCPQSVFESRDRQYVRFSWLLHLRCVNFTAKCTHYRQPCIVPYSIVWRSVNKNIFFNTALVHFLPHRTYCIYTHANIICAVYQVRWNLSTFSHSVTLTQFVILSSHLCVGFPIIFFMQTD